MKLIMATDGDWKTNNLLRTERKISSKPRCVITQQIYAQDIVPPKEVFK